MILIKKPESVDIPVRHPNEHIDPTLMLGDTAQDCTGLEEFSIFLGEV